jgi:two-component system chemotaxis response regulator CheY
MSQDANVTILIADGSREMTRIVRSLLCSLGFNDIDEAMDGVAAIAKLRTRRYDLLISDIQMEPMGGLELASTVRGDNGFGCVRIIMMSSSGEETTVLRAGNRR